MGLASVRSELDDLTAQLTLIAASIGRTGDDLQIDARSLHETGSCDAVNSIARRLDDQGLQLRRLQARITKVVDALA
ncbi:hypothetical protein TPB0596_43080 [Tsukamurella pulmonis]|uniref:Uncharacterized protein n=1 Tax=Tsukamurella pulmonis TaxID=47312 RepID=A0A1H1B9R8_9ACTN|nr:hypothetical protein [Tsukamurella pulmonis]KXO94094.1 hypothetical protein AXK56_21095 [Tsukamurella pulmonis]KXP11927.1 hypothetical protein AXK57_20360 [Tsukamurella pulmonis]RDH12709.1 hypothetical protein DVB88_05990 [Tsukamurella pulmonis]SDQ48623.1 hypothetical protein SAMN04489765_0604 [Tsukamurella pulmonis]SUP25441.1 Uncharacterised protein [Tsukamurella pulmonis]